MSKRKREETTDLLKSYKVFLFADSLGTEHCDDLKRCLTNNGAVVSDAIATDVNVIVTNNGFKLLQKLHNAEVNASVKIVWPAWVTESVSGGTVLPLENYSLQKVDFMAPADQKLLSVKPERSSNDIMQHDNGDDGDDIMENSSARGKPLASALSSHPSMTVLEPAPMEIDWDYLSPSDDTDSLPPGTGEPQHFSADPVDRHASHQVSGKNTSVVGERSFRARSASSDAESDEVEAYHRDKPTPEIVDLTSEDEEERDINNTSTDSRQNPIVSNDIVPQLTPQIKQEPTKDEGHIDTPKSEQSKLHDYVKQSLKTHPYAEGYDEHKANGEGGIELKVQLKHDPEVNIMVIKALEEMASNMKMSADVQDQWRHKTYKEAAAAVKLMTEPISVEKLEKGIKGIGPRTSKKIIELITSGSMRRLEKQRNDEKIKAFKEFSKVFGAGPATYEKWWRLGFRTLEDVKAHRDMLTRQQREGLLFAEEFDVKIPYAEVAEMEIVIKKAAQRVDPSMPCLIGGSYRRREMEIGDVDVLMCSQKGIGHGVLQQMIEYLKEVEFLKEDLSLVKEGNLENYHGVCQLPGRPHRRIDLRLYAPESWGPGLIHYTGDTLFNRSLRLRATQLGYRLHNSFLMEGEKVIPMYSEEDIFQILKLRYIEPHERKGTHPDFRYAGITG
eukprot:GILK01014644.1.p1 GENE.GILK01014644.1~~GILK01014644.1.p1  ORF type:complete len:694 (+),score=118.59 GILK01014644.1:74-2083(+)